MPSSPNSDNHYEPSNKTSNEKRMIVRNGCRKRPAVPLEERKRARKACVILWFLCSQELVDP